MKRIWWLLAGLVSVLLLSLCFYGVRLQIMPRWMLFRALDSTLAELDTRFEDSPGHLLAAAIDRGGRQEMHLQLEKDQKYLGIVRYDMSVRSQLYPCRIMAEGTVVALGKALDLSLFLNEDFAAVSSQDLVDGNFYGISYDTFSQDIRSRELLAALIGEETISQWEKAVASLQAAMNREIPKLEITLSDVRTALYGVLALKPQVSKEHTPDGVSEYTHTVTFRATGQELAEAAEPYREKITGELLDVIDRWKDDPMTLIEAKFYLHKGTLVQIQAELESSAGAVGIDVGLGSDPETSPLTMELRIKAGSELSMISLQVETSSDEEAYRETISLVQIGNNVRKEFSADYVYDLSSGEMKLCLVKDGAKGETRLHLAGQGECLTVTTQDISPLVNLFREKPWESAAICTFSFAPGSAVGVPVYRTLSKWSVEDLYALLSGLGDLLGLKLP